MSLHRLSKMGGAPLRAVAIAYAEEIKIIGKPKEYIKKADLEMNEYKHFVQIVGPNFLATDMERKLFNLRTGFLEQRDELKPETHVFTSSGLNWMLELIKIIKNRRKFSEMNNLAIIPASRCLKTIPKKNIKNMAGLPLIAWTINCIGFKKYK